MQKASKDGESAGSSYTFEHAASHSAAVLSGLRSLRARSLLFDVTLVVQGEKFQAHKVVLAACSEYFRAMFTDAMKESRQAEITLAGVSARGVRHLLDYAYTAKLTLNLGNIHCVLGAASHLALLPVVSACADFLHSQLELDNCVDVLTLAETYTLLPLRKTAYCFLGQHLEKLSWLPQFQRLSPLQLQYLLQNDYPIEWAEADILKALLTWVQHDTEGRRCEAAEILQHVHYQHISERDECALKESPLFSDLRDTCPEIGSMVLNEFVKVRSKKGDCSVTAVPSGIVNVRGFEPAIVNIGGFKALRGVSNDLTYYHPAAQRWQYLTTIPHVEQCDYGIAVSNNQLYVVGGCFNQALQSANSPDLCRQICFNQALLEHIHSYGFRYDPRTSEWSAIRPMLHERCRFYLAAVSDKLYAIGGHGEGPELPDGSCESYDIAANTWFDIASMPVHTTQQAGAVMDGKVYITGGLDPLVEDPMDQLFVYNTARDLWEEKEPMLTPRCDHCMVSHGGHRLLVAGGWQMDPITLSRHIVANVDCYDLETGQWTTLTQLPTPRYHASMVVLAERLYLIGGFAEGQFNRTTNAIEVLCLDGGGLGGEEPLTWERHAAYPHAIWEHATAVMYIPTCLESRTITETGGAVTPGSS